jgi:hypothetical protein
MIVKLDELKFLPPSYEAPVIAGVLWRSLALSPYSLFTRASLDRLTRKYFKVELNNDEPYVAMLNIRFEIYHMHRCTMVERTVVLGAASVREALAKNVCIAIVPMIVTLSSKALEARLVRAPILPLGGAQLLGFIPTSSVGTDERLDIDAPLTATPAMAKKREHALALLNSQLEGGSSIHEELASANKVQFDTLIEEMGARAKKAEKREELVVLHVASTRQNVDDDDEEAADLGLSDTEDDDEEKAPPKLAAPVAAKPVRDEVLVAEIDPLNECGTRFRQVTVPQSNDLALIKRAIMEDMCTINMRQHVLCSPEKLIARARCVRAPVLSSSPLWQSLFPDDDETEFYIATVSQLTDVEDEVTIVAPTPAPVVAPVSTAVATVPTLAVENTRSTLSRSAASLLASQNDTSWLDELDSIDLALVHLYELETYARTRLKVLLVLLRASEAKPRDRAIMLSHRIVTSYPAQSGATRDRLALLGVAAKRREPMHQSIALMMLALASRDDPQLRESLLMLELLYIEHYRGGRTVLSADDDDDEQPNHEKRMEECCTNLEKFWARSESADKDSFLGQRLARLALIWRREISEFVARRK